jgi:hypothetical protein
LAATGEAPILCLVSGQTVSWRRFYEGHAAAFDLPPRIIGLPLKEVRNRVAPGPVERLWALRDGQALWALRSEARILKRIPGAKSLIKRVKPYFVAPPARPGAGSPSGVSGQSRRPTPRIWPDPAHIGLMALQSRATAAKAKKDIGFEPSFSFDDGVARTAAWARWAQLA